MGVCPRLAPPGELFRQHLAEGLVDEIRQVANSGLVLGTPRFQQQVAELLGRRTMRGTPGVSPGRRGR